MSIFKFTMQFVWLCNKKMSHKILGNVLHPAMELRLVLKLHDPAPQK